MINNVPEVFTGFFITFVFIGASTAIRPNVLFIVFCSITMLLVLISPFYQGVRYLVPLVPFLFYFFIAGFQYAVFHIYHGNKFKHLVYYSVIGFFIFLSIKTILIYSYESKIKQQEPEGPYKITSVEMLSYIRNNSSKNEIIGFCKDDITLALSL